MYRERGVADRRLLSVLAASTLALAAALPVQAQVGEQPPSAGPLAEIDAGPAVPISPYYSALIAGADQSGVLAGIAFPLRSSLRFGVLEAALVNTPVLDARWLTRPVFLMGADAFSLRWLKAHGQALHGMAAAGIIVAAEDVRAFKRVQTLADDLLLPVAPGPDSWLEQQLQDKGITRVPILIQLDGTATQTPGQERPL